MTSGKLPEVILVYVVLARWVEECYPVRRGVTI